jgi:hypothetical protein
MKVLKALDKQIVRKPEQTKRRSIKKQQRAAKLRKCLHMMYGRRYGNFEPLSEDQAARIILKHLREFRSRKKHEKV